MAYRKFGLGTTALPADRHPEERGKYTASRSAGGDAQLETGA